MVSWQAAKDLAMAPHWGRHGWTYIRFATVEEPILRNVLLDSWRQNATLRNFELLVIQQRIPDLKHKMCNHTCPRMNDDR